MLLEIKDLQVKYGSITAVKGIELCIEPQEIVTVLGANGAGKSTLLRAITGLVKPSRGQILFQGSPLADIPAYARVHLGISMVPEGRGIFPNLTVYENLLLGKYPFRKRAHDKETRETMNLVFDFFPVLKEREKQYAGTLSGGEQQMLSIGRALLAKPKLLLLDEPSMGLSPIFTKDIFKLLPQINQGGTTILLVEQNANAALKVAHRGYVLDMGLVSCSGTSTELYNNNEVCSAYLV